MISNNLERISLIKLCKGKGVYGLNAPSVPMNLYLPTYLRITDISDSGDLITGGMRSVDHVNSSKYYLEENDIVFARTGASTGRAFFYEKKYGKLVYAGFLIKFSIDEKKVNPKYLKYYVMSSQYKGWVTAFTGGSTRGNINAKTFGDMLVELPPRNQQDFLVKVLSSLDDKIELNNKINKNLEEIAQTLYKRWFVDFEFPNENGEPYQSSGGEMVESELGMIPKGWEVKDVNSLFDFKGGSQPPKEEHIYEPREGYVRFIQNRDYGNGSSHLTYIKVSHKNKLADKYDIMMDKYGEVGKIRYGLEGAYNVALAKIESCDKLDQEILRGYFSQETIVRYLSNSSIASTRGSLNATTFTGLKVAYPEKPLKLIFHTLSRNIIEMILEKKSENSKLGKIRDELLPKLMSGEIEVPVEE